MCKLTKLLLSMLVLLLLVGCDETVKNARDVNRQPLIYPDYKGVTIPCDIAPMNFNIAGDTVECIDVVVGGSLAGTLHTQGAWADFDLDDWHALTNANKGGTLRFTVCVKKAGQWLRYRDFEMYVSPYPLDAFGITYRRIPPGYEVGGNIGIYQRDIHNFDETPILQLSAVPGQCMNCHLANQTNPRMFTMQVRGAHGGTLVQIDGRQQWLNMRTDSTKANTSYGYWHPTGNYCAFSTNKIFQSFFTGKNRRIEVYDTFSDVLVYDTRSGELLLSPLLQTDDWETYPAFSPDGKTLYFCKSKACRVPAEYDKVRYSLCKISFDAQRGTFGDTIEVMLDAAQTGRSYTYPRPSYDGRYLMYSVTDYGNFPVNHREADLWLMDLQTGQTRPISEVNSRDTESFHNWSRDSHWFVFSSRRENGMYSQVFFASIDDKGRCTKPFLLPQRNPWAFYHGHFDSYNCVDFTSEKVQFDAHEASRKVLSDERQQVKIKTSTNK